LLVPVYIVYLTLSILGGGLFGDLEVSLEVVGVVDST